MQRPTTRPPPPPPPPPIEAMSWIVNLRLLCDIAVVRTAGDTIAVGELREALRDCGASRWVLFVYGPSRVECVVERAAIHLPEAVGVPPERRNIAIAQLPTVAQKFLSGGQTPVADDDDKYWWSQPPQIVASMETYRREATKFLSDLRSENPLRTVNQLGLWITLRSVAAVGYAMPPPPPP
jgi:hypothetical protein